ncbi:MAG: transglutaminase family protein [Maricaulaceae bacterium]|jgi:transglutaminase-like putative cysteine protease
MLYDVSLRIVHRYDRPAVSGRHVLRLVPASLVDEQQGIAASLDIDPLPQERGERFDFFGAKVVDIAFDAPHDEIEFTLRARVRRQSDAPGLDLSPPATELWRELQAQTVLHADSPHHFASESIRAPLAEAVTDFAHAAVAPGMTTLQAVEAVGHAVHAAMTYDVEATTVETPMEQAFANRHGVCQDLSHVMISGLRGIGVPAGYVSGYLRTLPPPGQPKLQGADAMHAWVRAWCGVETGWVDYDPTNAVFVHDDHIVVARGRDYADVAPVKGVLKTAGAQSSEHAVDVITVDED